jgi:hypothetical protein
VPKDAALCVQSIHQDHTKWPSSFQNQAAAPHRVDAITEKVSVPIGEIEIRIEEKSETDGEEARNFNCKALKCT